MPRHGLQIRPSSRRPPWHGRARETELEETRHGARPSSRGGARAGPPACPSSWREQGHAAPLRLCRSPPSCTRHSAPAAPRRSAAGGGGAAGSARTTPTPAMAAEGGKWGLQPSPLTRSGAAAAVRSDRRRGDRGPTVVDVPAAASAAPPAWSCSFGRMEQGPRQRPPRMPSPAGHAAAAGAAGPAARTRPCWPCVVHPPCARSSASRSRALCPAAWARPCVEAVRGHGGAEAAAPELPPGRIRAGHGGGGRIRARRGDSSLPAMEVRRRRLRLKPWRSGGGCSSRDPAGPSLSLPAMARRPSLSPVFLLAGRLRSSVHRSPRATGLPRTSTPVPRRATPLPPARAAPPPPSRAHRAR